MKHINTLDDDSLRLIFAQIPLQQYPVLVSVCFRWSSVALQICAGKRSLKLFYNREHAINYWALAHGSNLQKDSNFRVDQNVIIYDQLDSCLELQIPDLSIMFPNIEKLVCHMPQDQLFLLLSNWPNLTFLCLFICAGVYDYEPKETVRI